jgi:hypothetical protein
MWKADPKYTITDGPVAVVFVPEFRERIAHLERIVRIDRHACASPMEIQQHAIKVQRFGRSLIGTICKYAKVHDWERRERIIEESTKLLEGKIL